MKTQVSEEVYQRYVAALVSGDRRTCTAVVEDLQNNKIDMKDIFLNLFQRSLYEVGNLWEHHQISVAVEHLASAITERLITLVEPGVFMGPHQDHSAVIACVADEFHQLGGRMVADIFEIHGWKSHFLGANTPHGDLISMIDHTKPDLVALSLSVYFNLPSLLVTLAEITEKNPHLPVLVGGQAFRWGGTDALSRYQPVRYVSSLDELEQVLESYGS